MRSSVSFVVAALMLAASPAALAQATEERADEIRRAIKVWVGQTAMGLGDEVAVELDDRIAVTPDGSRYRVILPAGRADFFGEGTLHFDPIEIGLTPLDSGWFDTEWRLPERYRFEPSYGSEMVISIGSQSGRGIFAPEFQSMMSLDAALGDLWAGEADGGSGLRIDAVMATMNSTETGQGIYDMVERFEVAGIRGIENQQRLFSVDTITVDATADGIRVAEYTEFYQRMQTQTLGMDTSSDPAAELGIIVGFLENLPAPWSGVEISVRMAGLESGNDRERVSVEESTFSLEVKGLDTERTEFAMGFGIDGAATSIAEMARLVPSESHFRLAVVDIPNRELADLLVETLRSMGTTDPAMAMMMASGGLQQAFVTAGSTLEIGPIRIATDVGSIDLEGIVRPDPASPYSVTGEIDMVAIGLDALIAEIQNSGGDDDAVQGLTVLQSLGAEAPDSNGRSVRTYAFRLDQAGTLLLNGSDIMPLIGALR